MRKALKSSWRTYRPVGELKVWQKNPNSSPTQRRMPSSSHRHKSKTPGCLWRCWYQLPNQKTDRIRENEYNFAPKEQKWQIELQWSYQLEKHSEGWPMLDRTHVLLIILRCTKKGHRTSVILQSCRERCPVLLNISPDSQRNGISNRRQNFYEFHIVP